MNRYSYDFLMPIGTPFTAARAGTVLQVEESHLDGEIAATGFDNYVVIGHDDGTADLYAHFTNQGAHVSVGQLVAAGATIGRGGNTGNTASKPHLHFSTHRCDPVSQGSAACPTLPGTFRNTTANPTGLVWGGTYQAH